MIVKFKFVLLIYDAGGFNAVYEGKGQIRDCRGKFSTGKLKVFLSKSFVESAQPFLHFSVFEAHCNEP